VKLHQFNWRRFCAMVRKEFIQMRRDRMTFGMMIGVPMLQLILFGYAINSDPKHLPTAVYSQDNGVFARTIIWSMRNSSYFDITREPKDEVETQKLLAETKVQFVVEIPVDFSRKLLRGEKPDLLLEADATDPTAVGYAIAAMNALTPTVLNRDLTGPLAKLQGSSAPFNLVVQQHYNPENITQYNIVPGLMGVMLTMTMVMITALAITRERERGTMENLLATPALPIEVMTGKIVPYVVIGLVQASIILTAARFVFGVPFAGSLLAIYLAALLFIAANLTVGITLSSIAQNQLQAMQLTVFYFLPSLLLSGFMFPFAGMPRWAQFIGNLLPLTYFNRLVRGILLKGNGWADLWPSVWPVALFMVVVMGIALRFYRRTLD
jgi:ABC-2 type transport system permease protein